MEEGFKTKSKCDFYNANYTHISPNQRNPVNYKENKMSDQVNSVVERKIQTLSEPRCCDRIVRTL